MGGLVREQLRMSRIDAYSAPTLETLTLFVAGAIVLYASYMVLVLGTLDAALLIMVMVSLASIGESLRKCSKVTNALQKSNAAAARVFQSLDMPVERPRPAGRHTAGDTGVTLPPLQREIRFTNVTFAYPGATGNALQDVNLAVARGRSIAIVGRNGSGKTTLMALLPRFYDPQGGSVSIDGVDLRAAKLSSVRRQMSLVTQDSVVFPVTIAQNIAYGNPRATQSQIESAAKRAFAHEFILEKPAGYATVLGEQGGSLSGGQRQRLCIARAILRDAPILILDEATSQVDAESEHLIQTAIQTLMHERTTFVIAHRLGTILSADEIVVMDRGRIIGQGSHEGLMGSCETYQQLYERQMVMAPAGE
jgi:ABC-type multidrug transport system fused ATPase/permease subunit